MFICGCINCKKSGNLCAGTAEPECDAKFGVCEQHQTRRHEEVPRVVPNGESIDLRWLLDPPVSSLGDSLTRSGSAACATVV